MVSKKITLLSLGAFDIFVKKEKKCQLALELSPVEHHNYIDRPQNISSTDRRRIIQNSPKPCQTGAIDKGSL